MARKRFPTFWIIVLFLAVVWLLSELGYITSRIPWPAAILVIIAIGGIINYYSK